MPELKVYMASFFLSKDKPCYMKVAGFILIVLGILMLVFRNVSFTQEKKVVDVGPLEVNKKERKTIGWPVYGGVIMFVAGISLVLLDRKQKG